MRYEIQYTMLASTVKGNTPNWQAVDARWTIKGARKKWWEWVNSDFGSALIFRIYDTKTKEVVS